MIEKRIQYVSLKNLFVPSDNYIFPTWGDFYLKLFQWLTHPRILLFSVTGLFWGLGYFYSSYRVLALTASILLLVLWKIARRRAESLTIELLRPPPNAFVQSQVEYELELSVRGSLPIDNLQIYVCFFGSKKGIALAFDGAIQDPTKKITIQGHLNYDVGMGSYEFGPIHVEVADPLRIFIYTILFKTQHKVLVKPRSAKIPEVPVRGSIQSMMYGHQELLTKGWSVNFSGVRPYVLGDSIRHIAWGPSAKRISSQNGDFVVKEFEKVVNTDVTVVLNLHPQIHIGTSECSSWEFVCSLGLSILGQMMGLSNSISYAHNNFSSERGFGEDTFLAIAQRLSNYDMYNVLKKGVDSHSLTVDPLQRTIGEIPAGSTLFYISALNFHDLHRILPNVKRLLVDKVEVILIFVDPFENNLGLFKDKLGSIPMPPNLDIIEQRLDELILFGATIYRVGMNEENQSLLHSRQSGTAKSSLMKRQKFGNQYSKPISVQKLGEFNP